jgi:hypothetical protein
MIGVKLGDQALGVVLMQKHQPHINQRLPELPEVWKPV